MRESTIKQERALRALTGRAALLLMAAVCALVACGHDAENAAQSARITVLEEQVRKLSVLSTSTAAQSPPPSAAAKTKPFAIECPQPWVLNPPLGATLW